MVLKLKDIIIILLLILILVDIIAKYVLIIL